MSNRHSLALNHGQILEAAVESQKAVARIRERGRRWILSGWAITMVGVFLYCRALFALDADGELLELLRRTSPSGWAALLLILVGVVFWLAGNLVYLKDALNAPEYEPDGTPKNHGTL